MQCTSSYKQLGWLKKRQLHASGFKKGALQSQAFQPRNTDAKIFKPIAPYFIVRL